MPKAGQIVIDISAGTAKFVQQLEAAKGHIREFGRVSAGSMAQSTAVIRELDLQFGNSTRTVTRFLTSTLGLGPALQALFPLAGGIAFGGMVVELGKKVYDFWEGMAQGAAKAQIAFRGIEQPLRVLNDGLAVSNARLENEIAKLEGRQENGLQLALAQAREEADKLGESLRKDLADTEKLLKEHGVGFGKRLFGQAGTQDLEEQYKQFQTRIDAILRQPITAKSPEEAERIRQEQLTAAYRQQIATVNDLIQKSAALQKQRDTSINPGLVMYGVNTGAGSPAPQDQAQRIALLQGQNNQLVQEMQRIASGGANAALTGKKDVMAAVIDAAKKEAEAQQKAEERTERFQLRVEELNAKIAETGHVSEDAAQKYDDAIDKLNAEEAAQLDRLGKEFERGKIQAGELGVLAQKTVEYYDNLKFDKTNEELQRLNSEADKLAKKAQEATLEQGEKAIEQFKRMDEMVLKTMEGIAKVRSELDKQGVEHRVAMIGIQGGSTNQLATLARQQDIERQDIIDRYNSSQKTQEDQLKALVALKGLQNQMEERSAELAKQQLDSLVNPVVNAASGQLADLITGKKTDAGKAFADTGRSMLTGAIERGMHSALDRLFNRAGKRGDTPANPLYTYDVNQMANAAKYGPGPAPGLPSAAHLNAMPPWLGKLIGGFLGLGIGGAAGGAGAAAGSAGESVSSSISYDVPMMAEGGGVDPGHMYGWQENGVEYFVPKTAGTVVPLNKMGGGSTTVVNNFDARGADLGVMNRMSQVTHDMAVSNAMRANAERAHRIPRRG